MELISLDPANRGWLNETPTYLPPVGIGEVMRAGDLSRQRPDDQLAVLIDPDRSPPASQDLLEQAASTGLSAQ